MDENKKCDHDCHDDGCDCGHDHDASSVIYITFDDEEKEVACDVLGIFDVDDQEYIALSPQDSEEILIYRYSEDGEEIKLDEIESDEEYEKVAEEFDTIYFADFDADFDEDFEEDIEE